VRFTGSGVAVLVLIVAVSALLGQTQQIADPDFTPLVERPSYTSTHPLVVLDEAHENFHTVSGRYKPFADLLRADGYRVVAGTQRFTNTALRDVRVLVIANAVGTAVNQTNVNDPPSAFTDAECDAVRDWVRAGGSLLLIADHAPFGGTAAALAARFGVEMGKGYAWVPGGSDGRPTTTIDFSAENGRLAPHPITRGVSRVVTFTGQSLGVPSGAAALLTFAAPAFESSGAAVSADLSAYQQGKPTTARSIGGRAQGVALEHGKGRVVVMGEAAMFSAQVIRSTDPQGNVNVSRMGLNVPGNDNQRFLLNILRWLTRLE
jgi:hypothetical protein